MAEPSKTNKERLKEITDGIESGIKELFQSDRFANYLRTMGRFHKYSVNNTLLIHMQKPDATLVAGFHKWKTQFGRNVKRGEKGITIIAPTPFKKKIEEAKLDPDTKLPLRDKDGKIIMEETEISIPMFKPVTVFDVSQTEGKPLPQLAASLNGRVQNYELMMEAIKRAAPVPIVMEAMKPEMDGYFSLDRQEIALREGMGEAQTVCAAVHEMTHATLHNYEQQKQAAAKDGEEPPAPKDRNTEEVEAESVSYAVCQYYGIETGQNSFGYIASWSEGRDLKELRDSLETINRTAGELISGIDKALEEICKERGIAMSAIRTEAPAPEPVKEETEVPEPTEVQEPMDAPETAEPTEPERPSQVLLLVDDSVYLHVQTTDDGYDYTLYDKESMRLLDGGQLDEPHILISTAALKICELCEIGDTSMKYAPLSMIETLQEAQTSIDSAPAAVSGEALEQALDEYPMPDPDLSEKDLEQSGYLDHDLLPLSRERAIELCEKDLTVYAIVDGGEAELMFEPEDIETAENALIFAVDRAEWEMSTEFAEKVNERMEYQPEREAAFLAHAGDAYAIYQIKPGEEGRDVRFMGLDELHALGHEVERSRYELVYTGQLQESESLNNALNELYDQFNLHHPEDYRHPSMSVSDIVAVKRDGVVSCHYCDTVGFAEISGFFKENPLKSAEMSLEDDYDMIDGIINNGPKQPTVAELEAQVRAGKPISLLDYAEAVRREKKPSVVERLKSQPRDERKRTAPKKSAERELL